MSETKLSTLMDIAHNWSGLSTCNRGEVGCVIVDGQGFAISAGYNGAPSGAPHCTTHGCYMEGEHCIRSIHAEMNAIITAARKGIALDGATCVTTKRPCIRCLQALAQAGVKTVVYAVEYYTDSPEMAIAWAEDLGLTLVKF